MNCTSSNSQRLVATFFFYSLFLSLSVLHPLQHASFMCNADARHGLYKVIKQAVVFFISTQHLIIAKIFFLHKLLFPGKQKKIKNQVKYTHVNCMRKGENPIE